MKTFCRTWIALVVVCFGVAAAKAELGKPAVVVSISGYDEQKANADFIGALVGQPNVSMQAEGALQFFTQGRGLQGLDKTKPWGFMFTTEGEGPKFVAFLPVSSAKELADSLAMFAGPAQDEGNGILKISPPRTGQEVYVRESNGWAFVTPDKYEGPLPEDPLTLLNGLNKDYDVAIRGFLQNIPASKKQEWLDQVQMLAGMMAQQNDQISEELQQEVQALQLKFLDRCLNDIDQVTLGWKLDKSAKNTHIDFTLTAVPGSPMAEGLKGLDNSKSDFAGFLNPEFAVRMLTAHTDSPESIEYNVGTVNVWRKAALEAVDKDDDLASDDDRASVKAAINQVFDVVVETIKTGKTDVGASVNLAPEKLQVAVGGMVADGGALEKAVKDLVELAKGEPQFQQNVTVTYDVENYKGVRFHQGKVSVPDENAQKVLGEDLEVYVGIGEKSFYISAGKDSLAYIKSIIDASVAEAGKQVLPFELTVSMADILGFGLEARGGASEKKLAEKVAATKGNDRIVVTVKPTSNGMVGRFELEGGALELFSRLRAARNAAAEAQAEPAEQNPF